MPKEKKGPPKKRGRKPKKKSNEPKPPPKKRGRKPKGGKIIKKNVKLVQNEKQMKPNVILHLKCSSESLDDLTKFKPTNYNPNLNNPEAFNINTNNKMFELQYKEIKHETKSNYTNSIINENINKNYGKTAEIEKENTSDNINTKELWAKLNRLKKNLRMNNVSDKRSACFWCTYEFDNPAVHIPKHYNGENLEVYGCFCSPECALSYLKNEQLDDSTKWERYALLNNVYGKVYDYKKNIKPAPSPHYMLEKYYGNLTIMEYRKLLSKERIFMVVDKPMTKILPELYEENNEIPNVYNNILDTKTQDKSKNTPFRLKRSQTKQTKSNALSSTFNL